VDQHIASGAHQAGDADDFARLNIKREILQLPPVAQLAHREQRGRPGVCRRALARSIQLVDFPDDHHGDQRLGILQQVAVRVADHFTVAQYGAAVAEGGYLIEV
ncbi:hypothetical protein BXA48_16405, partial [Enterococcus faecium]